MSSNEAQNAESPDAQAKERIIFAATKVFARCPFNMATLRMIAQEAKVNHALIMYHFQSKENLYRVVLDRAISRHCEALRPIHLFFETGSVLTKKDARRMIRELIGIMIDGMYDTSVEENCHVKILLFESCYPSAFYPDYYRFLKKNTGLIAQMIMTLNGKYDYETAVFKASAIFSIFAAFDIDRELLKRMLGFEGVGDEARKTMKELATRNAFLMLEVKPS